MVSIKLSSNSLTYRKEEIQLTLNNMKEEVEDHLVAINENTTEIQGNYEYLCLMEVKMEKLAERIEQIQLFLQKSAGFIAEDAPKYQISPLNRQEKEIFLFLYTLEDKKGAVSYAQLARYCCLTEDMLMGHMVNMIGKGVPITKKYISNKTYLRIDKRFKSIQAKQNILKIEQKLIKNFE